jgi:mRNA-degrading endonuclease RelE of RelBE toxin-antitoxin system
MFRIDFTDSASDDVAWFRKREQAIITERVAQQLTHQPHVPTRNRKRLRPNQVAEWELRVEDYRVFYNVDVVARRVIIEAVAWKMGSKLVARGEEFSLYEDH